jgi:hypothetical protein
LRRVANPSEGLPSSAQNEANATKQKANGASENARSSNLLGHGTIQFGQPVDQLATSYGPNPAAAPHTTSATADSRLADHGCRISAANCEVSFNTSAMAADDSLSAGLPSGLAGSGSAPESDQRSENVRTETVKLELSAAEALVLFEWLARADDGEQLPIDHPAEQTVLWRVEGQLEKQVPVLSPQYRQLLDQARRSVDETA